MNLETLEHNAARIRASDFEGWVAHTNTGDVIYEALEENLVGGIPLGAGIKAVVQRPDRTSMDWTTLPHDIVDHIELYWRRDIFENQPVARVSRPPGDTKIRFIQYKMRGLQFNTAKDARRTGIMWYRLGFWDTVADVTKLVEVGLKGAGDGHLTGNIQELQAAHPCWPKPLGFGINPVFVGLKPEDVPSVPTIPGG